MHLPGQSWHSVYTLSSPKIFLRGEKCWTSKDPFSWEDCGLAFSTTLIHGPFYGNVISTCWRRLSKGASAPVYREMGLHGQRDVPHGHSWVALHVISTYLCKSTVEHPCTHEGNSVPMH